MTFSGQQRLKLGAVSVYSSREVCRSVRTAIGIALCPYELHTVGCTDCRSVSVYSPCTVSIDSTLCMRGSSRPQGDHFRTTKDKNGGGVRLFALWSVDRHNGVHERLAARRACPGSSSSHPLYLSLTRTHTLSRLVSVHSPCVRLFAVRPAIHLSRCVDRLHVVREGLITSTKRPFLDKKGQKRGRCPSIRLMSVYSPGGK